MNNAMAQLAEVLNIDHAKMPRETMAQAVCEKALAYIDDQAEKIEQLRGITPEIHFAVADLIQEKLPRFGLRWNGPTQPLVTPMDDGYWTPYHIADALLEKSRTIKLAANLVIKYAEEAQSDTGKVYVIDADWIDGLSEIIDESAAETNGMAI